MYSKYTQMISSLNSPPAAVRPSLGATPRRAKDKEEGSFASLLTDIFMKKKGGDDFQLQAGLTPPDKKMIQELILKIQERMNDSLLHVATDGCLDETHEPLFLSASFPGGRSYEEDLPSKIRRLPPKSGDISPPGNLEAIIEQAANTYGIDKDLIRSIVRAESNFAIHSTSPRGAMGLMQLMPDTARELGVKNSYDPFENIMGGTRYLKKLLDRYHGDVRLALAAYNWGMGNVERNPDKLPRETIDYISRVTRYARGGRA